MIRVRIWAAAAVCALSLAGCGTSPVVSQSPSSSPSDSSLCSAKPPRPTLTTPSPGVVFTVPTDPVGATATFYPGLSGKWPCATAVPLPPAVAARLAADINAAAPERDTMSCTLDDGTRMTVDFTYADGAATAVLISLSGCRWMTVPGYVPRGSSQAVMRDLKPYAPRPWNTYVSSGAR